MYRTLTQRLSRRLGRHGALSRAPLLGRSERADGRRAPAQPRVGAGERRAVARDVRALIVLHALRPRRHRRRRLRRMATRRSAASRGLRRRDHAHRRRDATRPYDRPPLSKHVLAGKWDVERATLATPERIEETDVTLRLGVRAVSLDVEASDGAARRRHAHRGYALRDRHRRAGPSTRRSAPTPRSHAAQSRRRSRDCDTSSRRLTRAA